MNFRELEKMIEFITASDFLEFRKISISGGDTQSLSFLNALLNGAKSRERHIPKGWGIWRAQAGCDTQEINEQGAKIEKYVVYRRERMKPKKEFSKNGRVNVEGDICFYAATDKITAMAEVRPWIHGIVTVGYFKLLKDIKIIDFSVNHSEHRYNVILDRKVDDLDKSLSREEINKIVWTDIDQSFSLPVERNDDEAEYVPTQKIAELIKKNGYDGIAYKSLLTKDGFNIALFDINCVEHVKSELFRLESIEYTFSKEPLDEVYHNGS